MKKLLIGLVLAGLPFASALAQSESPFAAYFFSSVADERTVRPSGLDPSCWPSKKILGFGASFEYTTPISVTLSSGLHYLGTHKKENCTPSLELSTAVVPLTVGYAFQLGPHIVVTPKLGLSVMLIAGEFNGQSDDHTSIKPTYGIALEGRLNRRWALRGELNRYTGSASLFGVGEFRQDLRVAQLGGVFRW